MEKWPFLGQNHWLTNFKIISVFRLVEVFIFIGWKVVFFVLEYRKTHFSSPYCLKKKVGKMSIFRLLELLVFIAQKGVFSFQNIIKDIFPTYIALQKKLDKWPFLEQNHGLTTLEKCQFFDFLSFLFLQPRKAFFRSRISQNTFFQPILP